MQPEFCIFAVESFEKAGALQHFQNMAVGRSSERERLFVGFSVSANGFDQLHEAQIGLGSFRYIKNNRIVILE